MGFCKKFGRETMGKPRNSLLVPHGTMIPDINWLVSRNFFVASRRKIGHIWNAKKPLNAYMVTQYGLSSTFPVRHFDKFFGNVMIHQCFAWTIVTCFAPKLGWFVRKMTWVCLKHGHGKLTVCYGKSLFYSKFTFSMAIFNSFLYVYQRVDLTGRQWENSWFSMKFWDKTDKASADERTLTQRRCCLKSSFSRLMFLFWAPKRSKRFNFPWFRSDFTEFYLFWGVAVSQFDVQTQQLFLEIFDKHLLARHWVLLVDDVPFLLCCKMFPSFFNCKINQ